MKNPLQPLSNSKILVMAGMEFSFHPQKVFQLDFHFSQNVGLPVNGHSRVSSGCYLWLKRFPNLSFILKNRHEMEWQLLMYCSRKLLISLGLDCTCRSYSILLTRPLAPRDS
jgi:hypothetical protein